MHCTVAPQVDKFHVGIFGHSPGIDGQKFMERICEIPLAVRSARGVRGLQLLPGFKLRRL
jgi:hypothetical protein